MGIFDKIFGKSKEEEKSFSINISATGITMNGQLFELPFSLSELKKILGEPERIFEGTLDNDKDFSKNDRLIWDSLGISVLVKEHAIIEEFCIQIFEKGNYSHSPQRPIKGLVTIHAKKLDESIKITSEDYLFKEMKLNDILIFISLTKDESNKQIESISIGKAAPKVKIESDKYGFKAIDGEKIEFVDFNFKLAIIEELMYSKELLKPKFDVFEFAKIYDKREIDTDEEGYEPIPEVVAYFEKLEIDRKFAEQITEIYMDGGNEIYMNIIPYWDGEDNGFDIQSYEDIKHFPNLKKMTLFCTDEKVFEELKAKGIHAKPL